MRIAREGIGPLALIAAVGAGAIALLPWKLVAAPAVAALAFTVWFFRDPERDPPADPGTLLSPADGKVIRCDSSRISVFMNVFDVHVCRSPCAGVVDSVRHMEGRLMAAFRDEASEHNERTEIVVGGADERVRFVLVAGLVARRIVCRVNTGQTLAPGERVGVIRFGSRVDLDLPAGARPEVEIGQRVRAGETILARLARSRFPL